ncbi:hypothetical protein AB0E01_22705 [Nocardia vinacea]|uniref:hypothetical protein n=1 Tax=Nocardia vinacea TaxID=96468 RepID=UPI0033C964A7
MSDEPFAATLRLKNEGYRVDARYTLEDVETGKEHRIFPADLIKLLNGVEIEAVWKNTSRGRRPAIRPLSWTQDALQQP